MIDFSNSNIVAVAAHIIGNRNQEEPLKLSDELLEIEDEKLEPLLRVFFLSNFTVPEYYTFTFSNGDHHLNPLHRFVSNIFDDASMLYENSVYIAKHLYEATQHLNIKSGDLYVAYIKNLSLDGEQTEAVGIFKSENKDSFLKLKSDSTHFDLFADEGTHIKKLDKGCLIFNQDRDAGFRIMIVDHANRSEAQFWKDDFLNLKPLSDSFHLTHNFMNLTRQYVSDQLDEEFSVSKADKIDLLNKSINFFKSKDQFNQAEFEVEVLGDADVIESFRNYGKSFMNTHELDPVDNFEISAQAVKRQAKVFKSVLKLDKNFHIYIHGNRQLIERGFDEVMGKHFYKIYFDEES
jgi:hypothetical protein